MTDLKSYSTIVELPNKKRLEVEYYYPGDSSSAKGKEKLARLFIQLDDCICCVQIKKSILNKTDELERIVHNKVINERGHLL